MDSVTGAHAPALTPDLVLTTGDVARRLRLSPARVRQLEQTGRLPAVRWTASGWRLYRFADVEALARQRARRRNRPRRRRS
jgi:DNA-binding transcriptional MerR regulator